MYLLLVFVYDPKLVRETIIFALAEKNERKKKERSVYHLRISIRAVCESLRTRRETQSVD